MNLDSIISISANGSRCLALRSDGSVWFWGLIHFNSNENIHLYQTLPIKIKNLDSVKLIHASGTGKCLFMKNDGSYWSYDVKNQILEKIILD